MSRIGKKPIAVPAGVDVKLGDGNTLTVKGPKGTLTQSFSPRMSILSIMVLSMSLVRQTRRKIVLFMA